MTKVICGIELTPAQTEAIAVADAHLNNVGLMTYSELNNQADRMSSQAIKSVEHSNAADAATTKLLRLVENYIDAGKTEAAKRLVLSLIELHS